MANTEKLRRRDFVKLAATTAAASGPFFLFPCRAATSQKTLRIAKWAHFIPEFDAWFERELAAEWGKQHDTRVIVDHVPVEKINALAAAEAVARKGHDLFIFPWPPAVYQQHVIDHTEIYQAVAARYGNVDRLGHRSTFDPRGKRYFAFCDSWIPAPFQFFQDYWAEADMPIGPVHYYSLRTGGQRIRAKLGIPVGLPLAQTLESNIALHSVLYGFRGRILDEEGAPAFAHSGVFKAVDYTQSLFEDAGSPDELAWGSAGNVRAMLARKTSCTINAISLARAAEKQDPEIAKKMLLYPPLKGPGGIVAVPHVTNCSAVWNFAQNQEGAKQFLTELIDHSQTSYEKSRGCNFPIYQKTIPDLIVRLMNDGQADPPWKYEAIKDALYWTRNLGWPGYATPAAMEIFNSFTIPKMFLRAVKGELSPADTVAAAETEVKRIAVKWKQT